LAVFNKILVPHDGSKVSNHALEYAARIASENQDSEIILPHVIPSFPISYPSARRRKMIAAASHSNLHDIYEELELIASQTLNDLKEETLTGYNKLQIGTHVIVGGDVSQRIIGYAKKHGVDLIVINSRATLGSSRNFTKLWVPLGGVSRKISGTALVLCR
jgi:nucleotide-binding universal stress UspA family protein